MLETHILSTRAVNTIEVNKLRFEKEGLRLKVIPNKGRTVLYGRIKAYSESTGTHLSFIDDDDISLIDQDTVRRILLLDKEAVYTNSYFTCNGRKTLLTPKYVRVWTLNDEKLKTTKPHQTFILQKDYILRIAKDACVLIKTKGWDENVFDYVCRVLISLEDNWHYDNSVTYMWNNNTNGLHRDTVYTSLNEYFFKLSKQ